MIRIRVTLAIVLIGILCANAQQTDSMTMGSPTSHIAPDSLAIASNFPPDSTVIDLHTKKVLAKIVDHPLFQASYIGVPLILGGYITKSQREEFRYLGNEINEHLHCRADEYIPYLPAATMLGMKIAGINGPYDWKQSATALGASLLLTAGATELAKQTFKVQRPDLSDNKSFPSGHTAEAFLSATILYKEYGHISPWIGIGAYTTATATGVLRVVNNRHWICDVLAGAGIGIIGAELGYWFSDLVFKRKNSSGCYSDFWDSYSPSNPSYLGLYGGVCIPLSKEVNNSLGIEMNTDVSSTAGIEGAGFLNHHFGIGGRATATNLFYVIREPQTTNCTLIYSTFQGGVFGHYDVYKHIHAGCHALVGYTLYEDVQNTTMHMNRSGGASYSAGVNIGIRAKQHFDVMLSADYNILPPHSHLDNGSMTTLTMAATAAIRF